GQKRYEEITELADRAMELPWVQRLADGGRAIAADQGRRVLSNVRDRARWGGEDGSDEDEQGADDEDVSDEDQQEEDEEEEEGNEDDQRDADDEDEDAEYEDAEYEEEDEGDAGEDEDEEPEGRRSRRGLGSVVSAARERGRVD
ncbi:MAG: hypothetical protein J2P57_08550, partial [Acidimicrobiaceae bacterium]|nr:hypothetical protein [Acidimicrobiaceae bacterium]